VGIVDPLANISEAALREIWMVIADSSVRKVVHAGQQDLEPVVRHLGIGPRNVFDTQIAAGFVDRPYPLALRSLVEEFGGPRLGKALTFTRWDLRPLTDAHLWYAADDVRYLLLIEDHLRQELARRGRSAWVERECARLEEVDRYRFDAESRVARLAGGRSLSGRSLLVLRELVTLRDEAARTSNLPPRTCLKDEIVMRIARDLPRDVRVLASIRGFPRPFIDRYGPRIIEAVKRAQSAPPDDLPRSVNVEESTEERVRLDGLWALVCARCHGLGIDPALVTSRRELALWYFERRRGRRVEDLALMQDWRFQCVGEALEELLHGGRTWSFAFDGAYVRADSGAATAAEVTSEEDGASS